jgi:hypothetical protein
VREFQTAAFGDEANGVTADVVARTFVLRTGVGQSEDDQCARTPASVVVAKAP